MGETGVGKTKLLEMLATLYGKGTPKWQKFQIHAGITDQKIVEFIEKINEEYKVQENKDELVWIFFDEINTCNSLGLITEIICNHTYLGKKINDNFVFLGACNPYRKISDKNKFKESGLVYHDIKGNGRLNNLVYTVNPLPHSLLNFIFDFGSLRPEDEKKYIKNTIIDIISRLKEKKLISHFDEISQNEINKIQNEIIDSIIICHNFMREKYDKSSVSLREIRRFGIFFEYFIKYFKRNNYDSLKDSLNMTLYLCYYLRLNDKKYREELSFRLNKIFGDFLKIPENEISLITKDMSIEKGGGIALNRALRENLFTCFICIENSVPLIIVGKPGTGKSLSYQILYNTLKGEYSEAKRFQDKGKLYRYYYQGSSTSTSEGIKQVFSKALKAKKNSMKSKNKIITLVFFDEMGLAEISINNPLKIIHYLLEKDSEESVPFLGISNWKLDAAKINRAVNLSITDYDLNDLEETAIAIAEAIDKDITDRNTEFFETLAKTYFEYMKFIQNSINENKDFHGNRDFYNLIKTVTRELIEREEELNKERKRVLTEAGLHALDRNFGGAENSNIKIKKLFKDLYKTNYEASVEYDKPFSVLDAIQKNISNSNNRYLMLISEGNDARDIVKYLLNSKNKGYIELIGSKYKADISSGRYSEEILNKIKYIMESDNILILKDLDMIYPSLYDLFNQNFIIMGEKKYARIAFEYAKISSEVNKDFHVIVLVNNNQIKNLKLDPPFLNRFEKHIINFNMILEERDREIAKKINDYIELISSFNNHPQLKIDLDNLLINCRLHHIEGLIFKIKNIINNKKEIFPKEEKEYEEYIIKEVLKIIVPTFCQDIIASMVISGIKPQKYNDMVLDIYKETNHPNFVSFFKNIKKRKNIIYTFSKITKDIFKGIYLKENKDIKNKYGIFNKHSTTIEMIESIKSEEEFSFILNSIDKNLLILKFTEKDLNKISSIHYVIDDFEKKYTNLKNKIIILIIHKQRRLKNNNNIQREDQTELISFFNDDYDQIFIDNLHGKEYLDISKVLQRNTDILENEYIYNPKFIQNNIFLVMNYLNYKIIYETKELNNNNYVSKITELILNNKFLQAQIIINLKQQGKSFKKSIKDVFLSDILEINDIDFIEVIITKLKINYCNSLLKIIYASLNDNILNPFIINKDINHILEIDYFKNAINSYFEKPVNLHKKLKMEINANEITVYNGLLLPKSKENLSILIKYFDTMLERFCSNEESLRLNYTDTNTIFTKMDEYNNIYEQIKNNLKTEINKNEFFKLFYINKFKEILLEEYLIYYIIKYIEKKEINYEYNIHLLRFLKLLIQIKLNINEEENNENSIQDSLDEFITVFIFTQGYKNDIIELLDRYSEIIKYCDKFDEKMKEYLDENRMKYEESQRNPKYTKLVNLCLFNIVESFIRMTLLYSQELLQIDKNKFLEYFKLFPLIEISLQKINKKYFLFSKEIYNLRNIIKIGEAFKNEHELFENNYNLIIDNILLQSTLFYCNNFEKLYKTVVEMFNILDNTFKEKKDSYINLFIFLYRQEYNNIYIDDIRIKLLETFFNNDLLLKNSKNFLVESFKNFKPELFNRKSKNNSINNYISDFMNLENKKFSKIKNILNICDKINSNEFKEILLYLFEGLIQSYFFSIHKKYKNEFNKKCCNEMLLGLSLDYLKKAIQYLYEHKNNNENNLLKLYAIAYIKTYCYFYVEIHKKYFEYCDWNDINAILYDKDINNKAISNMRNIYILRLYYKTFSDFEEFITFDFSMKKFPIIDDIIDKLRNDKISEGYVFDESFITPKILNNYKALLKNIESDD